MVYGAAVIVVLSGLPAAPVGAQEPGRETRLLYQALVVFQQHCLKCHGDSAKGGVRLLDPTLLLEQRHVIHPGSPETSVLIDLVEGGSMPPGDCPKVPEKELECLKEWIRDGARALPSNESYVLWSIVCDLRELKTDEDKRSTRYLSLNHLLARESTNRKLTEQRENLRQVLRKFASDSKQPPSLRPIEPTGTVYRINLTDFGWHQPPYPKAEERWSRLNWFDLVLLEYPDGRLPNSSPFYREELLRFLLDLQEAGQVRPVPYVRADWLTELITQPRSPLYREFHKLLGKAVDKPIRNQTLRPDPLEARERADEWGVAEAFAERSLGGVRHYVALPVGQLRGDAEKKRRVLLGEQFAELLDRSAKPGIPIVPLDGLTHYSEPSPDVEFRAVDFKDRDLADPKDKSPFFHGDEMALWLKTKWDASVEVIITDKNGEKYGLQQGSFECQAGMPKVITFENNKPFPMKLEKHEEEDMNEFTIFAYPLDALKATGSEFPKGALLKAERVHDRVVHPLYQLQRDGRVRQPDASKMVKVTLQVTTRRRGAKKD
jgi:hypothetical protein